MIVKRAPWSLAVALLFGSTETHAQTEERLVLAVDADDDDEDGAPDCEQPSAVPEGELLRAPPGLRVEAVRGLRLIEGGRSVTGVRPSARVRLQATGGPAVMRVHSSSGPREVALEAVRIRLVRGARSIEPERDALDTREPIRLEVEIDDARVTRLEARVESTDELGRPRDAIEALPLTRGSASEPLRSAPIHLVSSPVDRDRPSNLRISLRDRVTVRLRHAEALLTQDFRVGRPGRETGPRAARQARLRMVVVRATPGGMPSIGGEPNRAIELARDQIAIAGEVWLACGIDFGSPEQAEVVVVDPPPPALVTVAGDTGFPAAGGRWRLRAAETPITLDTRPGASPLDGALALADAIRSAGLLATVFAPPEATHAVGPAADVLVRQPDGRLATLTRDGDHPLSTDRQQPLTIGRALIDDGLDAFDDSTRAMGTTEERTLLLGVIDGDPRTIDVVVVPFFADPDRAGEAFLERDAGPLANVVVIDREGVARARIAWTLAHELGHVLLDDPLHAEDYGLDERDLLMDADGADRGGDPRLLSSSECERARRSPLVAPRPEPPRRR